MKSQHGNYPLRPQRSEAVAAGLKCFNQFWKPVVELVRALRVRTEMNQHDVAVQAFRVRRLTFENLFHDEVTAVVVLHRRRRVVAIG